MAPHTPITRKTSYYRSLRRTYHRSNRLRLTTKLVVDYVVVIPALIFLAPLFLLIALLIKWESPGPILFRQRALGHKGREFSMLSFRTVFVDADDRLIKNRRQWVALLRNERGAGDPRLTRVGDFLRRSGLVMLPCLFNILRRDMSLVGPFIVTRRDIVRYGRGQIERLTAVSPGFTGLWQLNAPQTTANRRLDMELDYIENWSLGLDIRILFSTFTAIRRPQNA